MITPKNFLIVIVATIAVSTVIILNPIMDDKPDFSNFIFDAVYIENDNYILITFEDQNKKSTFAILEVLGMETTYHNEFVIIDSKFSQSISIETLPKYGWKATPVILEITYDESEVIKMKTEVHDEGQSPPEIIFEVGD